MKTDTQMKRCLVIPAAIRLLQQQGLDTALTDLPDLLVIRGDQTLPLFIRGRQPGSIQRFRKGLMLHQQMNAGGSPSAIKRLSAMVVSWYRSTLIALSPNSTHQS